MIIIYGVKNFSKIKGVYETICYCPYCQTPSRWAQRKTSSWVSLFWVPLIPIHFGTQAICGNCNAEMKVKKTPLEGTNVIPI